MAESKAVPANKNAPAPHQTSPQPQKQKEPTPGVPGDESSKTPHRGEDARSGQDKDGNEGATGKPTRPA